MNINGNTRTPSTTAAQLQVLRNTTDVHESLVALVDLVEHHVHTEICEATKFSQNDGKPVEYGWRPLKRFESSVLIDDMFAPHVARELRQTLGYENATSVMIGSQPYCLSIHSQCDAVSGDRFGEEYAHRDYLDVRKVVNPK